MRDEKLNRFERNMRKIVPVIPQRDERGWYLEFCSYYHHPGVIGEEKAEKCHRNDCQHLQRYYKR